jgi:hypothetical protein
MTKISKDHVENFGKVPLSPYMTGEQPEDTAAAVQSAAADTEVKGADGRTWAEPSIVAPTRSMNTTVLQSKRGGNSVVINDEGADGKGSMLIVHRSGSVIQINEDGTVLIKSFGDTHNNTEGLHYQRSKGDSNVNVGGEWNVMIEGGSNNIYVKGDMNIECENYNVTARGKMTFNAGEAIEMQGAKFSLNAHSDNFDLAAKNIKIATSEAISLTGAKDIILNSDASVKLRAKENVYVKGDTDVHIFAEGGSLYTEATTAVHVQSGENLHMNVGAAAEIEVGAKFSLNVADNIEAKAGADANLQAGSNLNLKAGSNAFLSGSGKVDLKAGSVNADTMVYLGSGKASAAGTASPDTGNTLATGTSGDVEGGINAINAEQGGNALTAASVNPTTFDAPPARTPRTESKNKVSKVQPRGTGISSVDVDDPS